MADHLAVMLPYQRAWLNDPAPVKVYEKSRRIGITWAEAADRALEASARGGCDTWYIGYNKDMALEFVATAADWARRFNKAAREIEEIALADERRDILAYRVRFASGHKIVALSSRPSNLRGKQGCAVIDEAAFHEDLPGLMKAALAFTMWGGRVRVISTHNGAQSKFNELVNDIRAGRLAYSLHRTTFDEAIAQGLYRRVCDRLGRAFSEQGERDWRKQIVEFYAEDADEELFCIPRASSGAFLSALVVEGRMTPAPVLRWEMAAEFAERPDAERAELAGQWCEERLRPALAALDPNLPTCFGEDFGRSGDLTVIWPLQLTPGLIRRTPLVVELRNIPFRQQEQILFYLVDALPRFFSGAMDARGNGSYLAETARQRYGARIEQVMLTEGWYREHMPRYKAAFEDAAIEIPRDADILLDHRSLVVENGVARVGRRRERGSDDRPRHGDSAVAAVLAFYASTRAAVEYGYTSARAPARAPDPFGPPPDEAPRTGALRLGAGAW